MGLLTKHPHYVIPFRRSEWDRWETRAHCRYGTLEAAKAAFNALPDKHVRRLAGDYIVVRYRHMKEERL